MQNLKVPYKSQWDADAGKTFNDCGPASIAMFLAYDGVQATTDEVFTKTGAGQGLIDIAHMQKALNEYGYTSTFVTGQSPDKIKQLIDSDTPVIALVHYGDLKSTQDKNFKGGHFFLVVGYREDGYFVNDPNFKDKYRNDGDHHFYTKEEFEKAWGNCGVDDNPNNSLLVITRKSNPNILKRQDNMVYNSTQYDLVCAMLGLSKQDDFGKDAPFEEVKKKFDEFTTTITELRKANGTLLEKIAGLADNIRIDAIDDSNTHIKLLDSEHKVNDLTKTVQKIAQQLTTDPEEQKILTAITTLQKPHEEVVKQYNSLAKAFEASAIYKRVPKKTKGIIDKILSFFE